MTKFNPEHKTLLSYGESLRPAMGITEQSDADQYFADYVAYIESQRQPVDQGASEDIARTNLGYFAGYYSSETRVRVERLFSCAHPIFGKATENGIPSAQEAFNAGMELSGARK